MTRVQSKWNDAINDISINCMTSAYLLVLARRTRGNSFQWQDGLENDASVVSEGLGFKVISIRYCPSGVPVQFSLYLTALL